jgi:uncharacterized protein YcbK (DUF882 family)
MVSIPDGAARRMTRNFVTSEFLCKHCGAAGIDPSFVSHLQRLRDYLQRPIIVTSGYRCQLHPVELAKGNPARFGRHTQGIAADITGPPLSAIWQALAKFPVFTGVGVSVPANFIHLDMRKLPSTGVQRVLWSYNSAGDAIPWDNSLEAILSDTKP